jgi:hypothetical protein
LLEKDTIALESANNKLNQHIAYNGLQNKELSVVKVVELNEDTNFDINRNRKERKKNRVVYCA